MPSPVLAQDALLPTAHTTPVMQNGTSADGAVQSVDVNAIVDNGDSTVDGKDAIKEGKEKAKAVMAASGVSVNTDAEKASSDISKGSKSPESTNENANGTSPSRKRSRSGSRLPSHTPRNEAQEEDEMPLEEYYLLRTIHHDQIYSEAMNLQSHRVRTLSSDLFDEHKYYKHLMQQRLADPGSVFGYGYAGYGNGITDVRPARIEYPAQKRRPGNRRAKPLRLSRKDIAAQSDQAEELVPIRLDIEFDKLKLRDTFTWNLHDRVTPPEVFAETLVEDFKLPPETLGPVAQHIHREILEQTQDFYPHLFIEEEALDPHLPYYAYKNDEMRVLVKLNITIGQHTLVDQFEWEINNPLNSPEEFAQQMTRDLSLSGEFTTAIAHSIREQSQMFTKSLYITGHPFDGRPVEDADIRDSFLPSPMPSAFRPVQSAKEYSPYLYELNEAELERTELSILREQRRQKRGLNRRGGPALPDLKDRQRTVRTLVISSVLPGAAEVVEDSRLFKVTSRRDGRGRRAGARVDGGDDSDESEEEESDEEPVAPHQATPVGTARTRNIRGAASAAQVAMRATIGRSATPEVTTTIHDHATRRSGRFGTIEREESVTEPTSLVIKLRISKDKLRALLLGSKNRASGSHQNTPQRSTPAASMPPPPSPAPHQTTTPKPDASPKTDPSSLPGGKQWNYYPDGRVDAPYPVPQGQAPVGHLTRRINQRHLT